MKKVVFIIFLLFYTLSYCQERQNTVQKLDIIQDSRLVLDKCWICHNDYGETEWNLIDNYIYLGLYSCKQDDNFKMLCITKKEYYKGDVHVWIGSDAEVHSSISPSGYRDRISTILLSKSDIEHLINVTSETEYPISIYGYLAEPDERTFKLLRCNYGSNSHSLNHSFIIKRYKEVIRFYLFNDVDVYIYGPSLKNIYYEIDIKIWNSFWI